MCVVNVCCVFLFLQFYSKNKGSIATTLLKPKQKQGTKSAEVELSKSKSPENICISGLFIKSFKWSTGNNF